MIPKPPPREGNFGFLYLPPYRVVGTSVAGEATCVQVPELDVCFDIGMCPRFALSSKVLAISHGHMDHVGGLAYFCSQRVFQGMGPGTIVCDHRVAPAIERMMAGYADLERQVTPYTLRPLAPDEQIELKNNIFLRAVPVEHTVPAAGYVVLERRSKLKEEFGGYPQEKLRELKARGVAITRTLEIPLVAYLGDTAPGPHLLRDDVRRCQIVIAECTFTEPEHKERARIGMHLHADDIAEWLRFLEGEALVLTHISRRTNLAVARRQIEERVGPERAAKVFVLMDHRANRTRYDHQVAAAEPAMEKVEEGGEEGATG